MIRLVCALLMLTFPVAATAEENRPNIVIILMDDMGYGDIGPYGAPNPTPHIDALAASGLTLTSFYAGATNCSPSRAGLLTGRVPARYGVTDVFFPESFTGLPTSERTMADLLREAGYATALIGKWHLGHRREYLPLQRGFDTYLGLLYSNDMHSPYLISGNSVADYEPDQAQLTRLYTDAATAFIAEQSRAETPFLLILSHTMPHVPLYTSKAFAGLTGLGLYADVVAELDWSVGATIAALERAGVRKDTLVILTSDNGPWLEMEKYGGSPGPLRGGKASTFEGGVRVPGIFTWPGRIAAGRTSDEPASFFDLLPTFADMAAITLPKDRAYDGTSLLPLFAGDAREGPFEYAYFEKGDYTAFRQGDWKLKLLHEGLLMRFVEAGWPGGHPPHGTLLFNLARDPGETSDLSAARPGKLAEMQTAFAAYRETLGPLAPDLVTRGYQDHTAQEYRNRSIAERHDAGSQ